MILLRVIKLMYGIHLTIPSNPPSPLKRLDLLSHLEANSASVLAVSRCVDHTGRDAPHRYRAVPILHLVKQVIVLGALGHRVFAPLLVSRRRRLLPGPHCARIAGLRYNRGTAAAVSPPRLGRVVRVRVAVVVV